MTVSDLENPDNAEYVRWRSNGSSVEKRYDRPARAAALASGSGVLVVEPTSYPNNAVIYNANGSMRSRLHNPDPQEGQSAFIDVYYINDELTVILGSRSGQMACVFDESGVLLRSYETR